MNSIRKGKPIDRQARCIVVKVYKAKLEECKRLRTENPNYSAIKETTNLTGLSESSVRRIVAEYNKDITVKSPTKKVPHRHWQTGLDTSDITTIRRKLYEFHKTENAVMTIKTLQQRLLDDLQIDLSKTSLHRVLRTIGFRFRKTDNNRTLLCERTNIKLQRIKYIRQVQHYREKGYDIIYYINSSHNRSNKWTDGSQKGLKSNNSTGSRLIMAQAGGQNGFVNNCPLLFKTGSKNGHSYEDIRGHILIWLKKMVLNNLEGPSVIVMDYSTFDIEVPYSSTSLKADMIKWLDANNIQYQATMFKIELYDLIKQNKHLCRNEIDDIIRESGHEVLRLPPHHPDLNPIENIWGVVKNRIERRNITYKLDDVKKIAEEEFQKITTEDWQKVCEKVIRMEKEYYAHDIVWEQLTERIIIHPCLTETESDSDE